RDDRTFPFVFDISPFFGHRVSSGRWLSAPEGVPWAGRTGKGDVPMPLLYEKRGQVAVLTLSRPEARNAWCDEYNSRFIELMPALEEDRDIGCVVLTGDPMGNAFSAGADLKNPKTHRHESVAAFIEEVPSRRRQSAIALVTDFAKPIVAAVNGYAIG